MKRLLTLGLLCLFPLGFTFADLIVLKIADPSKVLVEFTNDDAWFQLAATSNPESVFSWTKLTPQGEVPCPADNNTAWKYSINMTVNKAAWQGFLMAYGLNRKLSLVFVVTNADTKTDPVFNRIALDALP